ncbi:MAG: HAD-IA family hydrolase [Candidatus Caenarcaniphilales bacterium]|nr:HAD-IA family hydrolase [Candidatus Caenarcaniphilales bacterium]
MSVDLSWGAGNQKNTFEDCELIVFDKDGTLIDFEMLWVNLASARAQRLANQLSINSPELFTWHRRLLYALGIDAETGKINQPSPIFDLGFDRQAYCLASLIYALEPDKHYDYKNCLKLAQEAQIWVTREINIDSLLKPIPGIKEFFDKLSDKSVKVALLTSDFTSAAETALQKIGLRDRFHLVRGSDRSPAKPNGKALLQVCESLEVSPRRAVMIGDSRNDMLMAQEADIFGLGIETMLTAEDLKGAGARGSFANWEDLRLDFKTSTTSPKKENRGEILLLRTDGASRGNPGQAAYGFVIYRESDHYLLESYGERLGIMTNNQAEYQGLIAGLDAAKKYQPLLLKIELDSELIVKQIKGEYRVRDPEMQKLHHEVKKALESMKWQISHIPRSKNSEADRLGNQALDQRS